jgi:Flp pilus assembly pilin Flp
MKKLLSRLMREEQGQDVIEYGLLTAGISIIAIPAVPTVTTWVDTKWADIKAKLTAAA